MFRPVCKRVCVCLCLCLLFRLIIVVRAYNCYSGYIKPSSYLLIQITLTPLLLSPWRTLITLTHATSVDLKLIITFICATNLLQLIASKPEVKDVTAMIWLTWNSTPNGLLSLTQLIQGGDSEVRATSPTCLRQLIALQSLLRSGQRPLLA